MLQSLMDPWGSNVISVSVRTEFEDNFIPASGFEKLSDSAEYIAILGGCICLYIFLYLYSDVKGYQIKLIGKLKIRFSLDFAV